MQTWKKNDVPHYAFYLISDIYVKKMTALHNGESCAARPERSSFCEEERRTKQRERRTEIAAQKNRVR